MKRVDRTYIYIWDGQVIRETVRMSEQLAELLDTKHRADTVVYAHGTDTAVGIQEVRNDGEA